MVRLREAGPRKEDPVSELALKFDPLLDDGGESGEASSVKRQQILAGARKCFLAQGFDGASMNDIVAAAGVSKGTVYSYFPSKEKLFAAMIYEDKRQQVERTIVLGDETRPVQEVLRGVAERLSAMFHAPGTVEYLRVVVAAAGKFPEIGQSFFNAGPAFATSKIAAYLERKMQDGTLRPMDPQLAATLFIDMVQAGRAKAKLFNVPWFAEGRSEDELLDQIVTMFLNGLGNPPAKQ